ncbi:uncharacterized protein F4812DRAFT_433496 [Daldinia caldariorum]|uniref:uncharacterized protein n=1 Tax=Daldinia caldariorum TaxID=326644 RepID=UPI0020079846|nr:uncharacterized protein F4812DRAFT_433496 [Daldinia caldariorum]KAI1466285.1 hypothetical protein F4812DRAFT_433496 [Daldinia caldariorum]
MAHPQHLASSSPARALHRVLVSNLPPRTRTSIYLLPPRLFSSSFSSSRRLLPNSKSTTTTSLSFISPPPPPPHSRALSTTPPLRRIDPLQKYPSNERIPYEYVRIPGPPPESSLGPAQPLHAVLRTLDLKTQALVMVAPPPPTAEPGSLDAEAAICRVVDKAALKAAAIEAAQRARRKAVDTKELEVSWGISAHDLGHKLRRLRGFLDQGLAVEVILARKRGGKPVSVEAAEAVLEAVKGAMAEVEGAKETRRMDGRVGGIVRLFWEGPGENKKAKKKNKWGDKEAEAEMEEKEKEKESDDRW